MAQRKDVYLIGGIRIQPVVKRFHKSGLILEASVREQRKSQAVMRRYREGNRGPSK